VWRILLVASSLSLIPAAVSVHRGQAIYYGKEALRAKIRSHDDILPAETVRCANCHEAKANARVPGVAAPRLDSALLLQMKQRRGGPPSIYNEQAFCRLLRTGSDPAYILIAREMPAYEVDDAQCAGLWSYLSERKPDGEAR
jgi:hypothetical protein